MKSLSLKFYPALFVGIAVIYALFSWLLVQSAAFQSHSDTLSLAITIDYCLIMPILFYFLVVKKLKWDVIATVGSLIAAIALASTILPKENHFYLNFAIQSLVLVEAGVLIYGAIKIRRIVHTFNHLAQNSNDFIRNLEDSFMAVMGRSVGVQFIASEITMLCYGLFFRLIKSENTEGVSAAFTMHRKVGYGAILAVVMVAGSMEMLGMHVLVAKYSSIGALVLTVLSIYSLVFLIADFMAMKKRPILLEKDVLRFRMGLRWSALIPISNIDSVQLIKNYKKDTAQKTLNAALLGNPNCKITLKQPLTVKGIYGIKKTVSSIVFNVDDEKRFIENFS